MNAHGLGCGRLSGSGGSLPSESCSQNSGPSLMIRTVAKRPGEPEGVPAMRAALSLALMVLAADWTPGRAETAPPVVALDAKVAAGFAALALKCLHTEYPSHISHSMDSDADAAPPHLLTPAFYGCYDWHSDVHGHWLLVRLLRLFPAAPFASEARAALETSFTAANIAGEVTYLRGAGRASFERPY